MAKFQGLSNEMVITAKSILDSVDNWAELSRDGWKLVDAFKISVVNLPSPPDGNLRLCIGNDGNSFEMNLSPEQFEISWMQYGGGDRVHLIEHRVYVRSDDCERNGMLGDWLHEAKALLQQKFENGDAEIRLGIAEE